MMSGGVTASWSPTRNRIGKSACGEPLGRAAAIAGDAAPGSPSAAAGSAGRSSGRGTPSRRRAPTARARPSACPAAAAPSRSRGTRPAGRARRRRWRRPSCPASTIALQRPGFSSEKPTAVRPPIDCATMRTSSISSRSSRARRSSWKPRRPCCVVAVAVASQPERAMVEGDAAEALREDGDLLPPAQVVAAGAVREDDGRAGAVRLVVEVDAVDGGEGHGWILGRAAGKRNREGRGPSRFSATSAWNTGPGR